ncbi:hypothetical protein CIW66_20265 [Enterobacter cloacae]|nr:hypothetical protein CIW67_19925 [Enterobacter cloacae]PAN80964.1 hypothetical protein CIW66_20265 [Enterobacter cloacae]PAN95247.1 hypothetical protein CIW63_16555 [Enterobacter cloacae]
MYTESTKAKSMNQALLNNSIPQRARILTTKEIAELQRDMAESSAKMRTELARRRNDCPTQQGL